MKRLTFIKRLALGLVAAPAYDNLEGRFRPELVKREPAPLPLKYEYGEHRIAFGCTGPIHFPLEVYDPPRQL